MPAERLPQAVQLFVSLQPNTALAKEAAGTLLAANQPSSAAAILDCVPQWARDAEYLLLQADVLGASGKLAPMLAAVEQARRAAPRNAGVSARAGAILIRNGQAQHGIDLLDDATRLAPGDRRILLLRAVASEVPGHFQEAAGLLTPIRDRWPEWDRAWLATAVSLNGEGRTKDARAALQTAANLGAHEDSDSPAQALNLLNTLAAGLSTQP